jgi:hypothetical protein
MPIDPRIALGVQPVQQQPNMLAQYAQVMGIKAAQQEMESNNAMRDLFAGGANFDDPEFQRRGYMANAKGFSELLGKRATTQKTEMEALGKEIDLRRDALVNVKTPEDYLKWHEGNHQGKMGTFFKSIGQTPNRESIMLELSKPGGLEKLKRESALGATRLAQEIYNTDRTRISAAAPNRQASLAEQKFAADQKQRELVRSILNDSTTTPIAPPATSNAPMGGGGGGRLGSGTFNIPMGGAQTPPAGAVGKPNVLATQVAPFVATPPPVNALLNTPVGQTGATPTANRVNDITRQLTQLAKVGGPEANQAMEGLVKEYNVLNPEGEIKITSNGTLVSVNKRTNKAEAILGADGQPVRGKVDPVIRSVLDQTDPAGKRMIDVDINQYVQGTGLGADGKGPAPKGVFGISNSQIPPNYMIDPANPQGLIPVPGSAADPNAAVPSGYRKTATGFEPIPGGPADPKTAAPPAGYRKTADGNLEFIPGSAADPSTVVPPNYRRAANGKDLEFIPGGPADPKVQAAQNRVKLSEKDVAAREAKYPQATSALKSFNAKTDKFDRDIAELLENKKGLDEITGFFAGRTDISAMSDKARRALTLFNTITAKGGFSELQDMRNASPTGGALGNVSNQEGKQLIDSFGALSRTQNANDLRKSLETARSDLRNLKERMSEAYELTYEYRNGGGGAPALPPGFKAD